MPRPSTTLLERVIHAFRLRPTEIVREADRIARELGIPSISRFHLTRLRQGTAAASVERIFIVVAAIRALTGRPFRAAELFKLEPAMPTDHSEVIRGHSSVPVFSRRSWRVFVTLEPESSSDEGFEKLYVDYGLLLRTIAMRGYRVPPDDAEALVHDSFIAYLERHSYIHDVKAWLSATVRNRCMNYWRTRHREAPLLPEHEQTVDCGAEASLETSIRRMTAAAVLARLGIKCRETLRGYYLHEEPKQALADRLSTSTGYIDQLLSTCRRRATELFRNLKGKSA
ncbi:MAG: sigma-70 family RNA polymerase sigma factor [Acidobacteriota bacterium]